MVPDDRAICTLLLFSFILPFPRCVAQGQASVLRAASLYASLCLPTQPGMKNKTKQIESIASDFLTQILELANTENVRKW